ncbi:MAG: DoxX family protein [Halodesulfurarchaeum sp.]|nr:DoxX family protein [Halodesulfurarchaeum sp.]
MTVEAGLGGAVLLVGRLLFGGMLLWMGGSNLRNNEEMVAYANANDVPVAVALVPIASGMLLFGSLGIVLGIYPTVAVAMISLFLVGVTPAMHPFWAIEDPAQRQQQRIAFQKNAALLGGALVLFVLSDQTWAYALDIGLW